MNPLSYDKSAINSMKSHFFLVKPSFSFDFFGGPTLLLGHFSPAAVVQVTTPARPNGRATPGGPRGPRGQAIEKPWINMGKYGGDFTQKQWDL